MKKYLLPREENFYKANLHCHSVLSDGELTPEELKEEYKSRGYSVLAYTDHDIGKSVCSASMKVEESNIYVRVTVIDHRGRIANFNGYFLDDL